MKLSSIRYVNDLATISTFGVNDKKQQWHGNCFRAVTPKRLEISNKSWNGFLWRTELSSIQYIDDLAAISTFGVNDKKQQNDMEVFRPYRQKGSKYREYNKVAFRGERNHLRFNARMTRIGRVVLELSSKKEYLPREKPWHLTKRGKYTGIVTGWLRMIPCGLSKVLR